MSRRRLQHAFDLRAEALHRRGGGAEECPVIIVQQLVYIRVHVPHAAHADVIVQAGAEVAGLSLGGEADDAVLLI